jgi:hypothetical protein
MSDQHDKHNGSPALADATGSDITYAEPPYTKYNGHYEPCDNANGPCCCGAWHKPTDWPNRVDRIH